MENNDIDEEFEEFIKKFKKDVSRLKNVAPLLENDKTREKVGIFYNAFYSHQLTKFTKYLAYATIALAASTVLQTISVIYGQEFAKGFVIDATRFSLIGIVLLIGIKVAFDILNDVYNFIKKKTRKG